VNSTRLCWGAGECFSKLELVLGLFSIFIALGGVFIALGGVFIVLGGVILCCLWGCGRCGNC
jgi:hypothetical protein